jgi:energy-coupling factor transporter ATP-binding protein EcfA2
LPFHFANGQTAEQLVARLASQNWRGAIIGPHGSGKSTLLASLIPLLEAAGICVISITPREGQRHLPPGLIASLGKARAEDGFLTPDAAGAAPPCCVVGSQCPHQILVIDGYEQLGWLDRWRMKCHCRRLEVGLLVTSHTAGGLPTLIKLEPRLDQIQNLVSVLCAHSATPVAFSDTAASYARHGSNVREIFFDLYDRHEKLRRGQGSRSLVAP